MQVGNWQQKLVTLFNTVAAVHGLLMQCDLHHHRYHQQHYYTAIVNFPHDCCLDPAGYCRQQVAVSRVSVMDQQNFRVTSSYPPDFVDVDLADLTWLELTELVTWRLFSAVLQLLLDESDQSSLACCLHGVEPNHSIDSNGQHKSAQCKLKLDNFLHTI
jgi:hypothetical protein